MQKTIKVEGMTCGHCEKAVKGALNEVDGVNEVEVDLETGKVTISAGEDVDMQVIEEAVEEQGYEVVSE
ncbi:heavy-metal-associated domain-containing protein [Halobacillus locisalis]|uniref:Heavy-metal-associated domain-containing protein n=1 Tax=Halobacillus locisalis TaxID=220753 RepID=A0A838CUJ9_9BACI|nr:cation transporter [Halobacillus locisalis]MBA2175660.1 heavy-metal-associated domain-containing protein [Halobacillus locisalis]